MNVQTLVELYDERPLENVLGVEIFRPEQVVYVCPNGTPKQSRKQLKAYFNRRGLSASLQFLQVDTFDTGAVLRLFRKILSRYPDAVIDITGGTDAVLFAAGLACSDTKIPVVTYSRTQNRFYSIRNASSVHGTPCDLSLSVEEIFLMAGGSMHKGRVDNSILSSYMNDFGPFFSVFLKYRTCWDKVISYIQRISPAREDGSYNLSVSGNYTVKGERGAFLTAPESALMDLQQIGMISGLEIVQKERIAFRFRDGQVRSWLRDVGSVLELYVYKACLDSGLFTDVRTSAVVDWNEDDQSAPVTNELDVMCTRGFIPVFISCKKPALSAQKP